MSGNLVLSTGNLFHYKKGMSAYGLDHPQGILYADNPKNTIVNNVFAYVMDKISTFQNLVPLQVGNSLHCCDDIIVVLTSCQCLQVTDQISVEEMLSKEFPTIVDATGVTTRQATVPGCRMVSKAFVTYLETLMVSLVFSSEDEETGK